MRLVFGSVVLLALWSGTPVWAYEGGDFVARAGFASVQPDASSSELNLDGGLIGGSEADVDSNTQLGLSFTYLFTDRWGIDVLASTPFTHQIEAATGALGLGTIDAGETKHLPPTVSVVYYPGPLSSRLQPYVGVGFNYTLFFQEDVDAELEAVLGSGSLTLDDSFGLALQVGVDYQLSEQLYLNAAVRWIDIDTDADFEFAGNRISTRVEIDPWVYMVALGWKF
ncbi:MAG: OmpW family protein [Pseudomonadales bacterium]